MATRRSNLILLALTLGAVFGVLALALPPSPAYQAPKLGLDLQGGLEIVLRAVPPKNHTLTDEDMDRSVEIMRARVDKLGVSEPEIRQQGEEQISIQLPGISDPARAASAALACARAERGQEVPQALRVLRGAGEADHPQLRPRRALLPRRERR